MWHPKLEAARWRLIHGLREDDRLARPFLADAVYSLHPAGHRDGCPTVAVDQYWRVYWSNSWVDQRSADELVAVIYHEVLHVLRGHHERLSHLPLVVANIVSDAEINDDLHSEGFDLPPGGVLPERMGWPNHLLAEEYARLLEDGGGRDPQSGDGSSGDGTFGDAGECNSPASSTNSPSSGDTPSSAQSGSCPAPSGSGTSPQGSGGKPCQQPSNGRGAGGSQSGVQVVPENASGAHGRRAPWEDLSPEDGGSPGLTPAEADLVRRRVAEAIVAHKSRGTVPGHLVRLAEDILRPPQVPWQRVLSAVVRRVVHRKAGAVDYSYRRPRRSQGQIRPGTAVLPSPDAPQVRAAVIVDTSGSVGDEQLAASLAEVRGILKAVGADVTLIACDAAVSAVRRITRATQAREALIGGGGTDMRVAIERAVKDRPDAVVVITDGLTPWPDKPPVVPVVVVLHDDSGTAPSWATVVKIRG